MSHATHATSGLLEFRSPVQYNFSLRCSAKLELGSSVVTLLHDVARGATSEICGAGLGRPGGSLYNAPSTTSRWLQPGRYRWMTKFNAAAGTDVESATLQAEWAQSPLTEFQTVGADFAFAQLSAAADRDVFAVGFVTVRSQAGERVRARLSVIDRTTNQAYPPSELDEELPQEATRLGAIPYRLLAGHLYEARVQIEYGGAAEMSCRLVQKYDQEP